MVYCEDVADFITLRTGDECKLLIASSEWLDFTTDTAAVYNVVLDITGVQPK